MSRRLPLDPDGRRQRTDPSFQPGSTRGRIGNASPVGDGGGRGRVRPTSPGNTGPGGGVQFFDQFDAVPLVAAGAQSKTLTYLPIPFSEHVFLNGVRQTRGAGADFTITGQTLNVLAGMDARVGDILAIEYAYSGGAPTAVSSVLVPFESAGWKYLQVSSGDAVDRSAVNFDDSGWSTGAGGFGQDVDPAVNPPFVIVTAWSVNSRLWLRRSIPSGAGSYSVTVRVDNNVVLYWNGTQFASASGSSETVGSLTKGPFAVPAGSVTDSPQVLAIRATDSGFVAFIDAEVSFG